MDADTVLIIKEIWNGNKFIRFIEDKFTYAGDYPIAPFIEVEFSGVDYGK
jgi:hypothetical protein